MTPGTWSQIGNGFSIPGAGNPALAALNGTDVAFIDSLLDGLRTYSFNGSVWVQVGSTLAIGPVGTPALAALNGTDVAFFDNSNDGIRTYSFTDPNWAQVGSTLSIGPVGTTALAALNSTDIAFIDSANDELRTYRFTDPNWAQVGSGLAVAGIGAPALSALNGTDVAFIDSTNEDLRTYRWDDGAGTWSQVGSGLAVAGIGASDLSALNGTDVAFIDSTNDELRTYSFDGEDWAQVGNGLAVAGAATPALAALNGTDVAFIDSGNDELRTYRFTPLTPPVVPPTAREIGEQRHARALADYLPNGRLFEAKNIADSNFRQLLLGLAGELFTAQGYITTLEREYFPQDTTLFLDEWEQTLGVPDGCFSGAGSEADRRRNVLVKLASLGVQTAADFEALALLFGKVVTVTGSRFTITVTGVDLVTGLPPYDVPFDLFNIGSLLECVFESQIPENCELILVNA